MTIYGGIPTNLAMDWMFLWVIKSMNHRRVIREKTIKRTPSIFLNMLKILFVSISSNLPTSNYEKRSHVKHNMMFEPNLAIMHKRSFKKMERKLLEIDIVLGQSRRVCMSSSTNEATPMICGVSGKMSQASKNVYRKTVMHHQPTKMLEIFWNHYTPNPFPTDNGHVLWLEERSNHL